MNFLIRGWSLSGKVPPEVLNFGANAPVVFFINDLLIIFLCKKFFDKFIVYLGFYVAFNTVQVISRRVVGRAEETSTYSSLGFCTVNCRPTASNYQLSHLRP